MQNKLNRLTFLVFLFSVLISGLTIAKDIIKNEASVTDIKNRQQPQSKDIDLEKRKTEIKKNLDFCLVNIWNIDPKTIAFIHKKLEPLLNDAKSHYVLNDFIELSKQQKINFSLDKSLDLLSLEDGVLKSPKEHLVVFENPYIRILWGSTDPGVRENFHTHAWKSIMLIIKPTTYEIEYPDGKKEVINYAAGSYLLPAGEKYACTNLGKVADESLRFEIK